MTDVYCGLIITQIVTCSMFINNETSDKSYDNAHALSSQTKEVKSSASPRVQISLTGSPGCTLSHVWLQ